MLPNDFLALTIHNYIRLANEKNATRCNESSNSLHDCQLIATVFIQKTFFNESDAKSFLTKERREESKIF
jgi:hypothetical protein